MTNGSSSDSQFLTHRESRERNALLWTTLWVSFCLAALLGTSWRLWWGGPQYPTVPFFAWMLECPLIVDRLLLIGICGSLSWAVVSALRMLGKTDVGRSSLTAAYRALALCLVGAILLNQHRCQPWAYQFAIIAVLVGCGTSCRSTIVLIRWLAIGIYLHSAISKFDFSFVDSYGQNFVRVLLDFIGLELDRQPVWMRRVLAGCLPAGELLVGIGLIFRRSRVWAVVAGCMMHVLLLLALGPWGLDHRPGVLLWNVFFVGQLFILFGRRDVSLAVSRTDREEMAAEVNEEAVVNSRVGVCVLGCVLLAPLGEPWGYWDHWPAWALYSSRSPRASLYVRTSALVELDESIRAVAREPIENFGWSYIDLDRWSLDQFGAPIYPQLRFRCAVMQSLIRAGDLEQKFRIEWRSAAGRWTGRRQARQLTSSDELVQLQNGNWVNSAPRRLH